VPAFIRFHPHQAEKDPRRQSKRGTNRSASENADNAFVLYSRTEHSKNQKSEQWEENYERGCINHVGNVRLFSQL